MYVCYNLAPFDRGPLLLRLGAALLENRRAPHTPRHTAFGGFLPTASGTGTRILIAIWTGLPCVAGGARLRICEGLKIHELCEQCSFKIRGGVYILFCRLAFFWSEPLVSSKGGWMMQGGKRNGLWWWGFFQLKKSIVQAPSSFPGVSTSPIMPPTLSSFL